MKISLNWLKEFVNLENISLDALVEELTMRAFEVEDISTFNDNIDERIVLGEILEITPHPNADKLQVTKTTIGFNEDGSQNIKQIVCGAKNIKVGQKVPVATLGAKLTNIKGLEIAIKESKIRDVKSCGMLCAAEEIGLSEDFVGSVVEEQGDGIFILFEADNSKIPDRAKDFKVGTKITEVLDIKKDFVLDIGARSNRGDALSLEGQAREIAALFKQELVKKNPPELETYTQKESFSVKPEITLEDECSLFYTLSVEGIEVKESPQWLKDRLTAVGMKTINNLVDISNYVHLELGQPMHFYDKDKLSEDKLSVRFAKADEKIKCLDDKEYDLNEANLLITNKSDKEDIPVGIAGVMGGFDSQITETSKNIVIESAIFKAATVRKSSRSAGIESEAKKRYERGVDKINTKRAILRSLELISKLAASDSGIKVGSLEVAGDEEIHRNTVELDLDKLNKLLGLELSMVEVTEILKMLDIEFLGVNTFSVPSYRTNDITREIDLIEEVARLYGYNNIPVKNPEMLDFQSNKDFNKVKDTMSAKTLVKNTMVANGFSQVILSSLVGDWAIHENIATVKMLNPLSKEYSVLRNSMLPSLLKAAQKNFANDKSKDIKIFEIGKTYTVKVNEKIKSEDVNETDKFAFAIIKQEKSWIDEYKPKVEEKDFFELKAIIEKIYKPASFAEIKSNQGIYSFMHPGIAANITYQGREIGYLAKIHPAIAEEWGLPVNTYFAELNLPRVIKNKFKEPIKNPVIERDITVDIKSAVSFNEIANTIRKVKSKDLLDIKLIDIYESSYTLRVQWHSAKELSREHVDAEVNKIKEFMTKNLDVEFRV
ncbi:MAG: phenylalanine--tRNA ligase subunit beta [Candidatus Caenarcaniphilales bacterium]|nr:phenylalanine--tRNA ligase subunit beta [Candidatus Caenarcaniphilales bacterium]